MEHRITLPLSADFDMLQIKAGDKVLLSGTVFTARDAAHKKLVELLDAGRALPVDLRGAAVYYTGPTPAKPCEPIGSCGPTTSYRMDCYTPRLLDLGLAVMIGKGPRGKEAVDSMVRNGAIYLAATGGAGALFQACVTSCEVVAFGELGAEALMRLEVSDMPLICAVDARGASLYNKP